MKEAQGIWLAPDLGDLTAFHPVEDGAANVDQFTGGRGAAERAGVGAGGAPAHGAHVRFGEDEVHGESHVREGGEIRIEGGLPPGFFTVIIGAEDVGDEVVHLHPVAHLDIAFIPDHLPEALGHGLGFGG